MDTNMLKKVYFLAQNRSAEVSDKETLSISNLDQDLEKIMSKGSAENELLSYLESLSFEDIKDLQTVMYLGRDEDYSEEETYEERFQNFRKYLDSRGWNSKKIEIRQISQKTPLDEYLLNGFKILNINI